MRELLEAINQDPAGIAFIVDDSGKLCGVVTDGDFRRMLLGGKSLEENLSRTDLGEFVSAKRGQSLDDLLKITNKKVRIIPIVNENGEPVDYFRYEHKTHFTPVAEPSLSSKELHYLTDAFLSTWISSRGKYIDQFEQGFSAFIGCGHGVSTANGTVAIHLALEALGIGKGDEVIVPDLTFAATINAVIHTGATPVIVDIDRQRWTIDPGEIRKAITPKTKAIIPVHIYGQPCEMDEIMTISREKNIYVVEDCAEAQGAMYRGQKVGSFGHISTFSFFANKILTTGEGGMCVTNSAELDVRMRVLRDHGMNKEKRYWHDVVGYNYRMTNLQAAIGCAQLERAKELIDARKAIELEYRSQLKHLKIEWQKDFNDSSRVVWLVCVSVDGDRDELLKQLQANQVDCRPFFYPLSSMPLYRNYIFSNKNSIEAGARGLNLPTVGRVNFDKIRLVFDRFLNG
jgi:perosamine synthetase